VITDDDQIREAIKRIARTPDGRLFHLGLQSGLMALSPSPDSGALQVFEGGRRFAQSIKAVMDEAITEDISGRPDQSDASDKRQLLVVAARAGVRTGTRRRGTRRRVSAEPSSGSGSSNT